MATEPKIQAADLAFCSWHDAPGWARQRLRDWVYSMERDRDRENGIGSDGAGVWLDEKIALSRPGRVFQTLLALYEKEVVWTGSIVEDDRGSRKALADLGYSVDAFFGLFNTRYDFRGRGIGWAGASFASDFALQNGDPSIALYTRNPLAERHYRDLGFECVGDVVIPSYPGARRLYVRFSAKRGSHCHS